MQLSDRKEYFQSLNSNVKDFMNKRHPEYLGLFSLYLPIIASCMVLINEQHFPWYADIVFSIICGFALGGLMMLGHEISHKTVVQSDIFIYLLSTLCTLQYGMTSTVWDRWHNRLHHVHTQVPFEDPDSWGYEKLYQFSRYFRIIFRLSPGSGKIGSLFFLFMYFSWQSFMAVFLHPKVLVTKTQKYVNRIFYIMVYVIWIGFASMKGMYGIMLFFLIPLAVSNFTMMMYISTNHFLSRINPLDGPNDILLNTLSVSVPRWMNFLHLNISYHIEHHLFPYISSHYYPQIQKIVKEKYPNKYQCLPILNALKKIYATPRFYLNTHTLIHPETRKTFSTIQ